MKQQEEQSYIEEHDEDEHLETSMSEECEGPSVPSTKRRRVESIETETTTNSRQPKTQYRFGEEDVETIENAITEYGCNYKSIWGKYYSKKTSQNMMKRFINSAAMKDVKEAAKQGTN